MLYIGIFLKNFVKLTVSAVGDNLYFIYFYIVRASYLTSANFKHQNNETNFFCLF